MSPMMGMMAGKSLRELSESLETHFDGKSSD